MERPSRYDTRSRSRDFTNYENHRDSATEWGEQFSTTLFDEPVDTIFRDSSEVSRSQPTRLSETSNDYLLALSSSVPGRDSREISLDWERSRGKSDELYKDMLALLDEPQKPQKKKTSASRRKPSNSNSDRLIEKKRKAGSGGGAPRSLAPIAPKPVVLLPPSKTSLQTRLCALSKAGKISNTQENEANIVLASADDFILTHLDDALSELEKKTKSSSLNGRNKGEKNKLALLLEIYSSVTAILGTKQAIPRKVSPPPPGVLQNSLSSSTKNGEEESNSITDIIEQKRSRALEIRREGHTDEAITLMREAKALEQQLVGLNLDEEDLADFPFGELDDVVPPPAASFLNEDADTLTFM